MPILLSCAATVAATVVFFAASASAQTKPAPAKPVPPTPSANTAAPVKLPAGVAARVNGKDITYAELNRKLEAWAGRPLLQQVVQSQVIEQEAKKYNVTVTPAELAEEVFKIKQEQTDRARTSGAGMMTWPQIAARDGISGAFVVDNVRLGLLARKAYTKFVEASIPGLDGQVKVAHIMLSILPAAPPKEGDKPETSEDVAKRDADAKAKITTILADITAKKISFEEAAKQFSIDKGQDGQGSAANGGELPWIPRKLPNGQPPADPAFVDAAFGLAKPGDITPLPVKTPNGYHLIKLIQKGSDAPIAEKAAYRKEQVDRQLQNQQGIAQWINFRIQNSDIMYNVPMPKAMPIVPKPVVPAPKTP